MCLEEEGWVETHHVCIHLAMLRMPQCDFSFVNMFSATT